jgi:hypothetical protein
MEEVVYRLIIVLDVDLMDLKDVDEPFSFTAPSIIFRGNESLPCHNSVKRRRTTPKKESVEAV